MIMKMIRTIGLFLFVTGFVLMTALLLIGDFRLNIEAVENSLHEKAATFLGETKSMQGKDFSSSFSFVQQIDQSIKNHNTKLYDSYSITNEEAEKLAHYQKEEPITFSISSIDSIFSSGNQIDSFKQKALHDYGDWLNGRTFASAAELQKQLMEIAKNINQFEIIKKLGIDKYQAKELKYSLTKASSLNPAKNNPWLFLLLTIGLCSLGALLYILPKSKHPAHPNNGIFNNVLKNRGWLGILVGSWLIFFYIILYFFPEYMTPWVSMVDPLSKLLSGGEAGRFFLYGFLYTLSVLVMGIRMLLHYRHSRYQILRTCSVMFFQTAFAFLLPEILVRLNKPYFDIKNIWPLDYSFFFDYRIDQMLHNGTFGIFMLGWGIALIILGVPVMVFFFGKRWYCSWVCGCGGLAETLGDPYRQLSSKKLSAWKIERYLIHGVLVFAVVMTVAVLYTYFTQSSWFFFVDSYRLREIYGSFIGAGFAGVVGTGFYPIMGNRVWCRFGCPLAAYLGIIQRFKSRFRITTNGGQCISCGNCSTYCEMGIDVRWYAQRGQNIVRSSCVGCGVCSAVCPRGVLNLEVKSEEGRFGKPILIGNNHIQIVE